MVVAKIKVDGVCAVAEYRKLIPAGIIGAQVLLDYADGVWQGLHKTVVFRGAVTKDVITDAEVVTIPAEVVANRGDVLKVGVYGVDAYGNLAIPTLWADLGVIRSATDPEIDITADPSLPVWAQIQAMIGNLDDLDTTAKNNLVAAVNEALKRGGGSVDAAEIQRIVEDYLAANPPAPGEPGADGKSAYEIALENGFVGSEAEWLESLRGKPGKDGAPGADGKTPEYGVDYGTPEQIADIANQAAGILADDMQKISDDKVDKVEGMGLSSNDYDNAAKAKVDAIPEDPKYTDTAYDDTEVNRCLNQIKDDLSDKVDFSKPQSLTAQQQTQAQSNIGIHKITQAEYDTLTDTSGIYIIVEE